MLPAEDELLVRVVQLNLQLLHAMGEPLSDALVLIFKLTQLPIDSLLFVGIALSHLMHFSRRLLELLLQRILIGDLLAKFGDSLIFARQQILLCHPGRRVVCRLQFVPQPRKLAERGQVLFLKRGILRLDLLKFALQRIRLVSCGCLCE